MENQRADDNEPGFDVDQNCIVQYLKNFPDQFITEMEITRRADGRDRFVENSHWAHYALSQLLESKQIQTDGSGRYCLASRRAGNGQPARKFIAPQLREILEHSGHKIDLSSYA